MPRSRRITDSCTHGASTIRMAITGKCSGWIRLLLTADRGHDDGHTNGHDNGDRNAHDYDTSTDGDAPGAWQFGRGADAAGARQERLRQGQWRQLLLRDPRQGRTAAPAARRTRK